MLESIVKIVRGIVKLRGATNNTLIGNTGDSLNVYLEWARVTGDRFEKKLSLNGAGVDFNANKNGTLATPVIFELRAEPTKDILIKQIIIFEAGGDTKLNRFYTRATLPNGCVLSHKSDNVTFTYNTFFTTNDVDAWSSLGGFTLRETGRGDNCKAILELREGILIRASGTHGPANDDYVRFLIRDNITTLSRFEIICKGILVAPGVIDG